jgi:hypothetical protein
MHCRGFIDITAVLKFFISGEYRFIGSEVDGETCTLRPVEGAAPVAVLAESPVPVSGVEYIQTVALFLEYGQSQSAVIETVGLLYVGTGEKNDAAHADVLLFSINCILLLCVLKHG